MGNSELGIGRVGREELKMETAIQSGNYQSSVFRALEELRNRVKVWWDSQADYDRVNEQLQEMRVKYEAYRFRI